MPFSFLDKCVHFGCDKMSFLISFNMTQQTGCRIIQNDIWPFLSDLKGE